MLSRIRLIALLTGVALCSACVQADEYFPASDSQGGWRVATAPSEVLQKGGMDLPKLEEAFQYASRSSQHGGLLVVRHEYLVFEKYYGRGNREAVPTMASVGKAFTSIACGIAIHEKKDAIPDGLDTKVFNEKYLPEAMPLDDPRKADITLGQLLSMAAGLHGEGMNPGFVNFEPSVRLEGIQRDRSLGQDMA